MMLINEIGAAEELPALLTISEAAAFLRIGRSRAYDLARGYLDSGGTIGVPVIRIGPGCLRVPRWALIELATTGRVVRLCDVELFDAVFGLPPDPDAPNVRLQVAACICHRGVASIASLAPVELIVVANRRADSRAAPSLGGSHAVAETTTARRDSHA
jgi:hypothetical protein